MAMGDFEELYHILEIHAKVCLPSQGFMSVISDISGHLFGGYSLQMTHVIMSKKVTIFYK